jgi:putative CocE/NonD family hydrolase
MQLTRREVLHRIKPGLAAVSAATVFPERGFSQTADAGVKSGTGLRKVRSLETVWIPMADGVKIAARIWLPEDAEQNPVPAIMEYIPYRRRDGTRLLDETLHGYLASYGYACVRPDIRGSGDSEGLPQDEYLKQEQDDGVEIIAWLAKQPWCTGKVGMFGISWGGFSCLQVAARRPPALKAIITHCSTDDRSTDDPHFTGGCINECMVWWGAGHTTNGARPPDPAIVGSRWRDMWMQRLNNLDFYVGNWFSHQHRDAFWKHASVDENYSSITCGVYAVGGWVDPYRCTVMRMLAHLKCPRKGLQGLWGHFYPLEGDPGLAMDWMTEALRWWDHWLKGVDTGIMDEPMYRAWMQSEPAMRGMHEVPGRWVAEDNWPSSRIKPSKHYLTDAGLQARPGAEVVKILKSAQTIGITALRWYTYNMDLVLPSDRRMDDGRSLTFDWSPLKEGFEILGAPAVTLDLAVDKPVAFLYVRLNEVETDGVSKRVTYGVLNLTHRNGHEFPEPLEPGKRYCIHLPLQDCAHSFRAGTRIRVAVSTTYWPTIRPSPEAVTLTVHAGNSELELPVRPPRPGDAQLKPFGPVFVPANSGRTIIDEPSPPTAVFEWDAGMQSPMVRSAGGDGRYRLNAIGTERSSA